MIKQIFLALVLLGTNPSSLKPPQHVEETKDEDYEVAEDADED